MAGIGFVLQKIVKRGGLSSLLKVALAGTIIVAGPWLLSIVGIFFIGRFAADAIQESPGHFMAVIIYSYAFSLFIFGGFHYIFTRQVADLIYEDKKQQAGACLVWYSILVACFSGLIAFTALYILDLGQMANPHLFRLGGVILFISVNLIWLLMIFISLLKRYLLIFFIYLSGMVISFLGVTFLGKIFLTGGAMFGFALGQLVIVIVLYIVSLLEYKSANFRITNIINYMANFKFLLFSGIFYYWGMWIDKIVYWVLLGNQVGNTFFKTYDVYDIPIYLANLTIIPGLIYFMIISETNFYLRLNTFLHTIYHSVLSKIQLRKYELINTMKKGLREQTVFQGIFTIVLILIAPHLIQYILPAGIDILVFRIALSAIFFHLLFLTIVIYLFYLQLFHLSFICTLIFFLLNLGGSIFTAYFKLLDFIGLSYLLAAAISSLVAAIFLYRSIYKFDRLIFVQATAVKKKKRESTFS